MKSITLRRTKTQKLDGKPILSLPPRRDHMRYLELDETEKALYSKVATKAREIFAGFERTGTVLRHYVHLLELILRLRQICTHPGLCKDYDVRIEALEKEAFQSNGDNSDLPPLASERAAYLVSLLRDVGDDRCCVCQNELKGTDIMEVNNNVQDSQQDSLSSSAVATPDNATGGFDDVLPSNNQVRASAVQVTGDAVGVENTTGTEGDKEKNGGIEAGGSQTLITATDTATGTDKKFQSTKVKALIDDLVAVRQTDRQNGVDLTKCLVFSQWTHMLDLIQDPLKSEGFKFVRLDGRMVRPDRTAAMEKFKSDPSVTIMLISLKAGGVGLNLTSGSRVYIMEPYWNPAVEQQAVDRVHRMGQKRPVDIVRFIMKGTIEDSILELQRKKLELAQMTFKEEVGAGVVGGGDDEADDAGLDGKRKGKGRKRGTGIRAANAAAAREAKAKLQKQRLADLKILFKLH
ncbi:hypothetical protein HK102_001822 [Quaeritorhiza haematococci]|nr:hypothetical protein HK102_001822 [Quaeritorhiza haematococci]